MCVALTLALTLIERIPMTIGQRFNEEEDNILEIWEN